MSRPQSPLSRQSTSLQSISRARTREPPALAPFLPAVPSLLAPLSPSLSALHAARISLCLNLPAEAAQKWCCARCGALRAGYGWKVVRVKRERPSARVSPRKGGKKRKIDAAAADGPVLTPVISAAPPSRPRNKLQGVCATCGTKFSMPGSVKETLEAFPSTRRTRRASSAPAGLLTEATSPAQEGGPSGIATPSNSEPASPSGSRSPSPKPQPPSLLRGSPALSHISTANPNPVTMQFPAVRPSELPPSSASSRSTSPIGGLPISAVGQGFMPPAKKRKKSGLARLLAESEKRKEQEESEGSALGKAWGLG